MIRWNGWGYDSVDYHLNESALAFLREKIGAGNVKEDAPLDDVCAKVPESSLGNAPLIVDDPFERIVHSSGQSFADWVNMRMGNYPRFVEGVIYPRSTEDIRAIIDHSKRKGIKLIPYGGGTSVVGHLTPVHDAPSVSVNMKHLNKMVDINKTNSTATLQCGVNGADLEAQLRRYGYTLGHFPQSFELSTLGGWIATRSSGQQSIYYGRIEQLFAGGRIETPDESIAVGGFPASAAGIDLREIVLGSEGRLGFITEAQIRISKLPEWEGFEGVFFPTFADGMRACQKIAQGRLGVSMMRLSNEAETEAQLALSGHPAITWLEKYLSLRGIKGQKCLLIVGLTGNKKSCNVTRRLIKSIVRQHGGIHVQYLLGRNWQKNRFKGAYLRNTLWDYGYGVDTVETATSWDNCNAMTQSVEETVRRTMQDQGITAHVFSHLSHMYITGTSIYTTYLFPLSHTAEETHERWLNTKQAISETIVANNGTISHQHGVGLDHRDYLEHEKTPEGMQVLRSIIQSIDPNEIMNPGKLIP